MDNPLLQIKDAVIGLLKQLDPEVAVFAEEIKRTGYEENDEVSKSFYFIDIIPTGNQTVDKYFTDIGVLVDIAFHDKDELNATYLQKQMEIDKKIRPVLAFGDRKVTINNSSSKISDHILHYSFPVSFRLCREDTEEYELMEVLETVIKKGE